MLQRAGSYLPATLSVLEELLEAGLSARPTRLVVPFSELLRYDASRNDVVAEAVKAAWHAETLRGELIGACGTMPTGPREEWPCRVLSALEVGDGIKLDLLLSPKLHAPTEELLESALSNFDGGEPSCKDVRGLAKAVWGLQHTEDVWLRLAASHKHVGFKRRGRLSPLMFIRSSQPKRTVQLRPLEEAFLEFLSESRGSTWHSWNSFVQSMRHCAPDPMPSWQESSGLAKWALSVGYLKHGDPGNAVTSLTVSMPLPQDKAWLLGEDFGYDPTASLPAGAYVCIKMHSSGRRHSSRPDLNLEHVESSTLCNTKGVRDYFQLGARYGGAMPRGKCHSWPRCKLGIQCDFVHLAGEADKAASVEGSGVAGHEFCHKADLAQEVFEEQPKEKPAPISDEALVPVSATTIDMTTGDAKVRQDISNLGNEIRKLKDTLRAQGIRGKKLDSHEEVKRLVSQLNCLKESLPVQSCTTTSSSSTDAKHVSKSPLPACLQEDTLNTLTDSQIMQLEETHCKLSNAALRLVFATAMTQGVFRLSVGYVLRKWLGLESERSKADLADELRRELMGGSLVPLVVAPNAKDAWTDPQHFIVTTPPSNAGPILLLSPVLYKFHSKLLPCLLDYCSREKVMESLDILRAICLSHFGLVVTRSYWHKLARDSKGLYRIQDPGNKGKAQPGKHVLVARGRAMGKPWKEPSQNLFERQRAMSYFLSASSIQWPSLDSMLESTRLCGPLELRATSCSRSKLQSLMWLAEQVGLPWSDLIHLDVDRKSSSNTSKREDQSNLDETASEDDSEGSQASSDREFKFLDSTAANTKISFSLPWSASSSVAVHRVDDEDVAHQLQRWYQHLVRRRARDAGTKFGKRKSSHISHLGFSSEERIIARLLTGIAHELPEEVDVQTATEIWTALSAEHEIPPKAILRKTWISRSALVTLCAAKLCPHSCLMSAYATARAFQRGLGGRKLRRQLGGILQYQASLLSGKLVNVHYSGSLRLGLDTPYSDIDLLLDLGDTWVTPAQLYEEVLLLQADSEIKKSYRRFSQSKALLRTFAVTLRGYYRGLEFDLVPMMRKSDLGPGLWQWNSRTQEWQQVIANFLFGRLQHMCHQAPEYYKAARLVKMMNESLPRWRRSPSHSNDVKNHDAESAKSPLASVHIMILALAAFESDSSRPRQSLPDAFLFLLKFTRQSWLDTEIWEKLSEPEPRLKSHLEAIVGSYRNSPELLRELPPRLNEMESAIQEAMMHTNEDWESIDGERLEDAVEVFSRGFGCIAPNPTWFEGSRISRHAAL